jgi:hypothetical protein
MAYTKPVVLAQNGKQGSFAAGCPTNVNSGGGAGSNCCRGCERTQ